MQNEVRNLGRVGGEVAVFRTALTPALSHQRERESFAG
jgi:hypothetical protein